MTITPSALQPGTQLTSAVNQLFAATGNTQVTSAVFTNTDSSVRTVTVYIGRSGGPAGTGNILINAQPIAIGQAYVAKELSGRNLANGDVLWASASANGVVNAVIDGFTIT